MYKIVENKQIKGNIYKLVVGAKDLVKNALPGQFVILMTHEDSERIPLTIHDYDKNLGLLTLIYQVVGAGTLELSKENGHLFSLIGPLGNPSELILHLEKVKNKKILFVAGGIGVASIYPQAKDLYEKGVDVSIIYGAKNKETIILEEALKRVSNELVITTDDGSRGIKGFVTDALKNMTGIDICVAIGPMIMMKNVSNMTKKMGIEQIVSMNPLMVDGTGMCGACRVEVGGEIKFACVDGPEFDGHKVNFDLAMKRLNLYKTQEGRAYLKAVEGDEHHGGCGNCER